MGRCSREASACLSAALTASTGVSTTSIASSARTTPKTAYGPKPARSRAKAPAATATASACGFDAFAVLGSSFSDASSLCRGKSVLSSPVASGGSSDGCAFLASSCHPF